MLHLNRIVTLVILAVLGVNALSAQAQESPAAPQRSSERRAELLKQYPQIAVGAEFSSRDTLQPPADDSADAQQCLRGLVWPCQQFTVRLEDGDSKIRHERLVRFPSAAPQGNEINDLVAMEWHLARDPEGHPIQAPAVVVVHESGSAMAVGRIIAGGLSAHGLHTFMLQMPGYGVRKVASEREVQNFLPSLKQAIADVRRARDAVAALPFVDKQLVAVEGTSLGGFVTAAVAGIDSGFQRYFILLAGGDLEHVVFSGQKDAAKVRERLEKAGVDRETIVQQINQIEPLRLAHRVKPEITWLFSGKYDDVVPPTCSFQYAKAAKLPTDHHIEMPVDHYSGALLLPKIMDDMASHIQSELVPPK